MADKSKEQPHASESASAKPEPRTDEAEELSDADLEQVAGGGDGTSTWNPN